MKKSILLLFCVFLLSLWSCTEEEANPNNNNNVSEDFKTQMLDAVNELRTQGCPCGSTNMPAVSALTWNDNLEQAALTHVNDMANNNNFSHTGTDGSSVGDRVTSTGYSWTGVAENIAQGQNTVSDVIQSWKNSEGHCKNMMNANYTEMGAAQNDDYWVQVFAKP